MHQKWPDQIFPTVNFVFSRDGHFGLGGANPPPPPPVYGHSHTSNTNPSFSYSPSRKGLVGYRTRTRVAKASSGAASYRPSSNHFWTASHPWPTGTVDGRVGQTQHIWPANAPPHPPQRGAAHGTPAEGEGVSYDGCPVPRRRAHRSAGHMRCAEARGAGAGARAVGGGGGATRDLPELQVEGVRLFSELPIGLRAEVCGLRGTVRIPATATGRWRGSADPAVDQGLCFIIPGDGGGGVARGDHKTSHHISHGQPSVSHPAHTHPLAPLGGPLDRPPSGQERQPGDSSQRSAAQEDLTDTTRANRCFVTFPHSSMNSCTKHLHFVNGPHAQTVVPVSQARGSCERTAPTAACTIRSFAR